METAFLIILPIIALLYSAVGHGGASGYLALMVLFGFADEVLRPTALTLNLFVAGISFIHFAYRGYLKFNLFLAFAITSVPSAYIGGRFNIDSAYYKGILGIFLFISVLKMSGLLDGFFRKDDFDAPSKDPNILLGLLIGGIIGFLSGLIGIGGGIILSPVILLLRWGTAKEAAAVSALFIWVNSAAGLTGQLQEKALLHADWFIMAVLVIVGGFLGGWIGSKLLTTKKLRYLLCFVLLLASIKLIFTT